MMGVGPKSNETEKNRATEEKPREDRGCSHKQGRPTATEPGRDEETLLETGGKATLTKKGRKRG